MQYSMGACGIHTYSCIDNIHSTSRATFVGGHSRPFHLPCYPTRYFMVESFQCLHHCVRDDPTLTSVQQDQLHERLLNNLPGLYRIPCLQQHPKHHSQPPLWSTYMLLYMATHSLLLYNRNVSDDSRGSKLTFMITWIYSKHCYKLYLLLRRSLLMRQWYKL